MVKSTGWRCVFFFRVLRMKHERKWGFGKTLALVVPSPKWSKTASRCGWNLKWRLHTGHWDSLNAWQTQDRLRQKACALAELMGKLCGAGCVPSSAFAVAATGNLSCHRLSCLLWADLHSEKRFPTHHPVGIWTSQAVWTFIHSLSWCLWSACYVSCTRLDPGIIAFIKRQNSCLVMLALLSGLQSSLECLPILTDCFWKSF